MGISMRKYFRPVNQLKATYPFVYEINGKIVLSKVCMNRIQMTLDDYFIMEKCTFQNWFGVRILKFVPFMETIKGTETNIEDYLAIECQVIRERNYILNKINDNDVDFTRLIPCMNPNTYMSGQKFQCDLFDFVGDFISEINVESRKDIIDFIRGRFTHRVVVDRNIISITILILER